MDTQQDDDPAGELGCVAENEAEKAWIENCLTKLNDDPDLEQLRATEQSFIPAPNPYVANFAGTADTATWGDGLKFQKDFYACDPVSLFGLSCLPCASEHGWDHAAHVIVRRPPFQQPRSFLGADGKFKLIASRE